MNRIKYIIAIVMMMCGLSFGCSSDYTNDESLGVSQQAVGTCTKPSGSCGDMTYPWSQRISSIQAVPATPWKIKVNSQAIGSLYGTVKYINFGGVDAVNSQASISGPGWVSNADSQLFKRFDVRPGGVYANELDSDCPNDEDYVCLFGFDTSAPAVTFTILVFDARYSAPQQGPYTIGKLYGIAGDVDGTQRIAFAGDLGTPSSPNPWTKHMVFEGPKLDACLYP